MSQNDKIWAEALQWYMTTTDDARKLVQQRALKKAPEGSVLTVDSEGLPATFLDEYVDVWADEMRNAFFRQVTDGLIRDGVIEVVKILPSGERLLRSTGVQP